MTTRVAARPGVLLSRTQALRDLGQSLWLDSIGRSLIAGGGLQRLIDEDGVTGVTSNPAIFEQAIAAGDDYADILDAPSSRGRSANEVYEQIATRDVRDAADVLRPVYDATAGRDGYVSLEVSPHLADDADGTVHDAHRLWEAVGRPNLMIKVPGTAAGMLALRHLIADGINVNVTLLFSRHAAAAAADAYMAGLEDRLARGADLRVASVASVFISRIDTAVAAAGADSARWTGAASVAVANAKLAYRDALDRAAGGRWQALAANGARTQRLLWASTGSKRADTPDVFYMEALIGPDTVDTVPPATPTAFRDHGTARATLSEGVECAAVVLNAASASGIDLEKIANDLLDDGLRLFVQAFDRMLAATERRIHLGCAQE